MRGKSLRFNENYRKDERGEKRMIKVAIAGLGFMGKMHLGVYLNLANAEVAALCDATADSLDIKSLDSGGNIETASRKVNLDSVKKYVDYDEMLRKGGFDVVDVCLPTYLHTEYVLKALDAGYHVFCEKPMAGSIEETVKILKKIEETKKLFGVGQCLRYWPAYAEIKKIVDEMKYGKVRYAEFARFSMSPDWSWKSWLTDSKRSGNAALDLHIHDVDMILYFFGFPNSVRSTGVVEEDGSVSHISTLYSYNDLVVTSTGGWICTKSFGFNMRALLILEKATIELDFSKEGVVTVFPADGESYPLPLPEGDGYYYELKDFISSVEKGELSGIVTPQSAADSVRLCLEEINSVKEKREIKLRDNE
jgi:predicted dehydrogenase